MLVIDGTFGQMIGNNIYHLNNERIFILLTNNDLNNLSIYTFDSCLLSVLGIEQNILRWLTGRLGTSLHYHCTSFEKNEFENFSILIFDALFITDL